MLLLFLQTKLLCQLPLSSCLTCHQLSWLLTLSCWKNIRLSDKSQVLTRDVRSFERGRKPFKHYVQSIYEQLLYWFVPCSLSVDSLSSSCSSSSVISLIAGSVNLKWDVLQVMYLPFHWAIIIIPLLLVTRKVMDRNTWRTCSVFFDVPT